MLDHARKCVHEWMHMYSAIMDIFFFAFFLNLI